LGINLLLNSTAVVIPTYNNPKTILKAAKDVVGLGYELVVVDDGSDIPVSSYMNINAHIVRHAQNLGKGAAILSGARKVKELGYKYFVSMDGDGQHLASQVQKMIDSVNSDNQIILGVRNFEIDHVPRISKIGKAYHNFWIRLNTGYDIRDSLTGFRLYPVSILDLDIKTRRFDFEVDVLVKHYWKHRNISYTTVDCYYPSAEERVSHFDNFNDTISITLLHLRLFAQRFFLLKGFF
jgi:glycosyltransferase involved in cell wall biosynthesis